jgi:hypothetical protein
VQGARFTRETKRCLALSYRCAVARLDDCAVAQPRTRRPGATQHYRNSKGENSARFLRQTIQVCMPGVSISVC